VPDDTEAMCHNVQWTDYVFWWKHTREWLERVKMKLWHLLSNATWCKNIFLVAFAFNPLNAKLNPICPLLALLGAHHILHVSR